MAEGVRFGDYWVRRGEPEADCLMFVQIVPFPASAGGSGPSSKWRLNITSVHLAGRFPGMAEIEMRGSVGGTDQCSGGTALASSSSTNTPDKAFDNNTSTGWDSGSSTLPAWIEYDFASIVDVLQLAITPSNVNGTPQSFDVQYYDTGTSSWTTYWSEDTFLVSSSPQLIFSKPNPAVAGSTRWRVKVISTQGGSADCRCAELEFRATSGGSDLTAAASADGGNAIGDNINVTANAFDNNTTTLWNSPAHPTSGSPAYLGYRFPTQQVVTEIAWTLWTGSALNGPTSFDVQYLDPTTGTWTTSWSVAASGTWTAGQTKVFTKP
jgi:hypothetical protein